MLKGAIERYIGELAQYNLSDRTIEAREYALRQFLAFLLDRDIQSWNQCSDRDIRNYIIYRAKQTPEEGLKPLMPSSLQTQLASIRLFFDFLIKKGIITSNPTLFIDSPKSEERLPDILEVELMNKILNKKPENEYEVRDLAICELLYSSGLRLSELEQLNWNDLDEASHELIVRAGKGGRGRLLPIGRKAISALKKWREVYDQWQPEALADINDPLFINKQGGRLGARQISNRVKRYAKVAGVNINLHPHLLRHSMATHLLESSQDIRLVQEMLGHADISTTQIYTHLDFGHLSKVFDQAHPRAQMKRSNKIIDNKIGKKVDEKKPDN